MAATLIPETDPIDVAALAVLLYGQPGSWKTSIACTAADPLLLDFDRGAHRSKFRKLVMRFDSWEDVQQAKDEIARHQTIVIDTVGRLLDMLSTDVIAGNARLGTAAGGLTQQGFGALKSRFAQWAGQLRLSGKDLVFVAHEKEERDGDTRLMRPDIIGGSYAEVMKFTDLVGYLSVKNGKRVLDFNPTDQYAGKNAAGWQPLTVPALDGRPHFLADLLADAKERIGKTAAASAELARQVEQWQTFLTKVQDLAGLNAGLEDAKKLTGPAKLQVWHLLQAEAQRQGWAFDKAKKLFVAKQESAA